MAANVHGQPLQGCSDDPLTGYYRDGFCHTGETDSGTHVVCAEMAEEFLTFTAGRVRRGWHPPSSPRRRARRAGINRPLRSKAS